MRLLMRSGVLRIISIALIVSAVLSLPAGIIYHSAKNLVIEELNKNANNIATTVARYIEADIAIYKSLPSGFGVDANSYDGAYYKELLDMFEHLKAATGADNIFTVKRILGSGQAFILAGSEPLPDEPPFGSSRSLSRAEIDAFNQGIMTNSGLQHDQHHEEYIIGYAPIFDRKTHQPVGIVGVEFTMDYVQKISTGINHIVGTSFLLILLLSTVVVNSLMRSRRKFSEEDYMTGLFNKRFFEKNLKWAMAYAKRSGRKLSVMMLDVDNFKTINDTLGHVVGDTVLKAVARHIRISLRHNDLCSRYGGDEFIIALMNTDECTAYDVAERIRCEILGLNLKSEAGDPIDLSLSIGIAAYSKDMDKEMLLECADKAMYISKNAGRNKTTIYSDKGTTATA